MGMGGEHRMVACAQHVVSHQRGILLGMQLRYRYRLEPTAEQRQALARAFGCARVVYNDALRLREDTHMAGRPFMPSALPSGPGLPRSRR